MSDSIQICVYCGFIHVDGRIPERNRKTHYHWALPWEHTEIDGFLIQPTVCHGCVSGRCDWDEFAQARVNTADEHYLRESYNATLPTSLHTPALDDAHRALVAALQKDWGHPRAVVRHTKDIRTDGAL